MVVSECTEASIIVAYTQDSTLEAAQDIAAFVAIFFEHFTKFRGRPFHMAGESYAVIKFR